MHFEEAVKPHPQKNEEKCVSKEKNTTPKNKQIKQTNKTNKPIASNLYIYKKRR